MRGWPTARRSPPKTKATAAFASGRRLRYPSTGRRRTCSTAPAPPSTGQTHDQRARLARAVVRGAVPAAVFPDPGASRTGADDDLVVGGFPDAAVSRRPAADPGRHVRSRGAGPGEPLDDVLADHPAVAPPHRGVGRHAPDGRSASAVRSVAIAHRR